MARSAVRSSRFDPDTDPFARRDTAHQLRSEYLSAGVKWILAIARRRLFPPKLPTHAPPARTAFELDTIHVPERSRADLSA